MIEVIVKKDERFFDVCTTSVDEFINREVKPLGWEAKYNLIEMFQAMFTFWIQQNRLLFTMAK